MTTNSLQQAYLDQLARAQEASTQEYGLIVVTDVAFADEPVQLADAYAHLRIENDSSGSADDAWLTAFIPAAREYCERYKGQAFATRTLELATNTFPTVAATTPPGPSIPLPFGPVQSITSLAYADDDGVDQAFEDSVGDPLYAIDRYSTPNRLITNHGETWPSARNSANSVRVRYVTGYLREVDSTGLAVLPRMAYAAILLMLAHLYEHREGVTLNQYFELPLGVTSLLDMLPGQERLGMA